ncbi:hypothetical protein TcCL_Unassigned03580, partial [Trypanosoma cruzi]
LRCPARQAPGQKGGVDTGEVSNPCFTRESARFPLDAERRQARRGCGRTPMLVAGSSSPLFLVVRWCCETICQCTDYRASALGRADASRGCVSRRLLQCHLRGPGLSSISPLSRADVHCNGGWRADHGTSLRRHKEWQKSVGCGLLSHRGGVLSASPPP